MMSPPKHRITRTTLATSSPLPLLLISSCLSNSLVLILLNSVSIVLTTALGKGALEAKYLLHSLDRSFPIEESPVDVIDLIVLYLSLILEAAFEDP